MGLVQQHVKEEINGALTQTKEHQEEQPLVSVNRADETGMTVLSAYLMSTSFKDCYYTEEKVYMICRAITCTGGTSPTDLKISTDASCER